MKKTIVIAAVAIGAIFTACTTGSASLKTNKDTVSYALGIYSAEMAKNLDSTVNVDDVVAGIRDAFAGKTKITMEQAQTQIQLYYQAQQAKAYQEFQAQQSKDSLENAKAATEFFAKKDAEEGVQKTASGLRYKIEKEGAMPKAALNDSVKVNYTLSKVNGEKIQSTLDNNEPFEFSNNTSNMIPGFVEGVSLLGKGGKMTMYIPAELAYGVQGNPRGGIAPAMALVFEVEVLDVKPAKK